MKEVRASNARLLNHAHIQMTAKMQRPVMFRVMRFTLVIPLFFVLSVLIHESGHAIAGKLAGLGVPVVQIWPGVELSPIFTVTPFPEHWPANRVASVGFARHERAAVQFETGRGSQYALPTPAFVNKPFYTDSKSMWAASVVGVMGSGLTYLISVICLLSLWLFKPEGTMRLLLFAGSLLFYDILFYAVFPTFFGLPHVIVFGSTEPEPVVHLAQMGVKPWLSVTTIIMLSAMHSVVLVTLLKETRTGKKG